jgi:hypothetical protein
MNNGYEHEVFISYRRLKLHIEWMQKIFMPLFSHYLELELPGARIFIDYEIETGCNWPAKLAEGLSRSKVLVGLWCRPYFDSAWCRAELSMMYARERKYNFNTQGNSQRLIIPATLHDGDEFPEEAKLIQQEQLQDYSHVWLAEGSQKKELLSTIICDWVPDIVKAIKVAPTYSTDLATIAYEEFMETFKLTRREQTALPRIGN